jgi:hypothetical protein
MVRGSGVIASWRIHFLDNIFILIEEIIDIGGFFKYVLVRADNRRFFDWLSGGSRIGRDRPWHALDDGIVSKISGVLWIGELSYGICSMLDFVEFRGVRGANSNDTPV